MQPSDKPQPESILYYLAYRFPANLDTILHVFMVNTAKYWITYLLDFITYICPKKESQELNV